MKLTFWGAAGTVTGSKHIIETQSGFRILLDCGMFQGSYEFVDEHNRHFGFHANSIDVLILSHAHIDHCGLIPRLVKQGFKGTIYCTSATRDLTALLLRDSARIQMADATFINKNRNKAGRKDFLEPLYNERDVDRALENMVTIPYNNPIKIKDEFTLTFTDAGHIIGSAMVNLTFGAADGHCKLLFTGDIGRNDDSILRNPQPTEPADIVICESTYGDRIHQPKGDVLEELLEIVDETLNKRRGKLLIPAFSVDRTQELIYALDQLESSGRLPHYQVFVDSPLSTNATDIMRNHPECFNDNLLDYLETDPDPFGFKRLRYVQDKRESQRLNSLNEPCIIISASGMMEAGRIKHHLANNIEKSSTTILSVGHNAKNTLGDRIMRGDKEVRIFGRIYQVRAQKKKMDFFSGHADKEEMMTYLKANQPADKVQKVFLVHGDDEALNVFQVALQRENYMDVIVPLYGESFKI